MSELVEAIEKVFALLEMQGGYPDEWERWTEEEQDIYYAEHSLLNVKPPPRTHAELDSHKAALKKTANSISDWLVEWRGIE